MIFPKHMSIFWFLRTVILIFLIFKYSHYCYLYFSCTFCLVVQVFKYHMFIFAFFCIIFFQNSFRLPLLFSFWHISHYKWSFCIVCTELTYIFRIFYYCIKWRYGFIILSKMTIWFWSTSNLLSVIVYKYSQHVTCGLHVPSITLHP